MTCHCLDRNASDWFKQISLAARRISSTAAIRVVTRHQYGITSLVPQTSFRGETSGGSCTATEMIPTIETISATEMTPNHHRNDPHHRNDTGGHHRNDPQNIGNGIKRTTKTGQQFSACFLFILFILHLFYGV